MPMNLKTRRYYQLIQDLNAKKRQQLSENVQLVGSLPSTLLNADQAAQQQQQLPQPKLEDLITLTQEDRENLERENANTVSPLEVLRESDNEQDAEEGWRPFPAPRSRL